MQYLDTNAHVCVHPLRQVDYQTVTVDEALTPGKCVSNAPRGIRL